VGSISLTSIFFEAKETIDKHNSKYYKKRLSKTANKQFTKAQIYL
jgi:cytochrome c-type biogenesis protein CcmE